MDEKLKCNFCERGFLTQIACDDHLRVKHPEMTDNSEIVGKKREQKKKRKEKAILLKLKKKAQALIEQQTI